MSANIFFRSDAQTQPDAISQAALQQIQALITEKESRTQAQQKIDSQLIYAIKLRRGETIATGITTMEVNVAVDAAGRVVVDITAQPSDTLRKEFARKGAKVISAFQQYRSYRIDIALDQLEAIAALPEVIFIQPKQEAFVRRNLRASLPSVISDWHEFLSPDFATRAQRVRRAITEAIFAPAKKSLVVPISGSVSSEGDTTHKANTARTTFGVNGAGVKIGVLSDGATNLALSQATGDLPANVTILPGQVGDGDEGTAMLEIIHDLAPGAQLFFATGFNSLASFAQNIHDLRTAGCDIIVDDLGYFTETPFQDGQTISVISTTNGGLLAQAVNDVTASGALYFSAAGNEGNKNDNQSGVWEGDFVDGGTNALLPGGTVHNFGAAVFDTITASSGGAPGVLYWSDPLGGSSNDYDLFVLNSTGTSVVTSSTNLQNGTQDPIEQVGSITANRRLVILKKTGAANRFLHLNTNRGRLTINTFGQTHGHSAGVDAFSVAATPAFLPFGASPNPTGPFPNPFNSTNKVEIYSSDGPRRLLYNANGAPITPGNVSSTGGTLRQKPDITAADGVTVTGVGGFGSPFYGTSAAAPHAAAIAALIKSGNRSLTPAQIRNVLTSTAIDIEAAGVDRDSGAGIVMAFEALQSISATPSPSVANAGSALTAESCLPGNSAIDPGETVTVNLSLKNEGNANTSNLVATLQSAGGVTLPGAAQNYGAIVAGGSAVSRPFTFTADATLLCGSTLTATLQLQDGATNLGTVSFSFRIGAVASNVTTVYSYTGSPVALPDLNAVEIPITVSDAGIITDVNVRVRLNHTFDGDLDIHLISPDGTLIDLSSANGTSGANYGSGANTCAGTFTVFDDSAATSILNGTAPFAGTFSPSGRLAGFNGKSLTGVWKLRILDEGAGDTGTLGCWQMEITRQTFACCTGTPSCPTVTNVAPNSGFVSNNVTITGTNFTGVTSVKFSNNVNALFTINNASQITATVPAGAISGPITISKTGCPDVTTGTFTVLACPTISATPTTLPQGTVGTTYNQSLTGTGGMASYSFALANGSSLPSGLSLASNGAITGTPMAAGSFSLTVNVTDANTCTGSVLVSLNIVCPIISATPATLPQGTVGTAYNQSLTGTGGTAPYTFALAIGSSLPNGLSLAGNGAITGTPMAAGITSFTINVTDGKNCAGTATISLTIVCPTIGATPATLPQGTVSTAYNQSLTGTGGTGPYTFALAIGSSLPSGLSLATNGVITGTPMAAGTSSFTVNITESKNCTGTATISLTIVCPTISATPATLPQGTVGTAYSQSLNGNGGTGPYTFALAIGSSLPSGLSLAGNGAITGTPMAAGTSSFTVNITDSKNCTGTAVISLTIVCPTISATPATLPGGTVGTAYNQSLTGTGGTAPYTFALAIGSSLPSGLSLATNGAITGTPMAAGTSSFTVNITDSKNCTGNATISLTIVCPVIGATPATLPGGTVGTVYNQSLTGTGGTGPYSFVLAIGSSLPSGLSLATNGAITGTPMAAGSFSFTVTITDSKNCSGNANISLTITCPTISATPATLPQGTVGTAYSQSLTGTGGTAPYSFVLAVGSSLPSGLSLASSGAITGTPMAAGSFSFTVNVTDSKNCTGSAVISLTVVCPTIGATPATLPGGTVGTVYSQSLTGTGGTAPYTFVLAVGSSLPSGLSLATNGAITGTPMAAGSFNFTVNVTDSKNCTGSAIISLTIVCPTITITPATLAAGAAGTIYNQSVSASGGVGPYTYVQAGGTLPPGLTFNSNGSVTGTPTQTGAFSFTAKATDSKGCMGTQSIALTINCPMISITPPTLPGGSTGTAYMTTLVGSGGIGTYSFLVTIGALPGGLTLTAAGVLSGTPTVGGNFSFTVQATDSNGCTGTQNYAIPVNCPGITISPSSLLTGITGQVYTPVTLTASGGTQPYGFSLLSGSLPAGMSLSPGGVISGTPTQSGSFPFTVKATDASGCMGTQAYTLAINCPAITVNPATLPPGSTTQLYNQTISASGGTASYNFNVTAGALPTGVTLSLAGALSGTPTQSGNFTFTITATDANGCTGARQYTLLVCPVIAITPATLSNGFVGTAYNATLMASGGTSNYGFTVSAGALPGGVSLSTSGALTGTPTATGTFNFTIKATDANGCMGIQAYTVVIGGNGLVFYPLPRPVRLLDTRANQGNCDNVATAITGGTSLTTLARLTCEGITIPPTAQAVVGNLTVLNQTAQTGYLTIYPDGVPAPLTANMIYGPGAILSNNFTVGLSSDGKFNVFGERTIDVVVDISGYYAPPGAGGLYYHQLPKPVRLLDTRAGFGNCDNVSAPIPAGTSLTTLARATCEGLTIPAAAQAIVGNATVINGSGQLGYLTIYPNGVPVPLAANLIYFPGQILSNAFTVSLNANGEFNIFGERTIDMVVDVAGYYSNEAVDANGPGLLFTPLARPLRILDTRPGQGNCDAVSTAINDGSSIATAGRLTCESLTIPATAQSVLGNVTVINLTTDAGFLTLYADGLPQPLAANMVYFPSQILSNAFVVGLNSSSGQFRIFAERTLDAIVDVSGYFAP